MSGQRTALLIVGSSRGDRSTSACLGQYLLKRLGERGLEPRAVILARALGSSEGTEGFLHDAQRCALAILSFPLYWDSLPALTVRALELWQDRGQAQEPGAPRRLVALCNSGFPEARQSATALGICQRFAQEVGLGWAGGLALGGGAALEGTALERAGGRGRHARAALELAAAALAADEPVPAEAVERMARPFVPAWAYTLLGSWGWRWRARAHGAHGALHRRPYQP